MFSLVAARALTPEPVSASFDPRHTPVQRKLRLLADPSDVERGLAKRTQHAQRLGKNASASGPVAAFEVRYVDYSAAARLGSDGSSATEGGSLFNSGAIWSGKFVGVVIVHQRSCAGAEPVEWRCRNRFCKFLATLRTGTTCQPAVHCSSRECLHPGRFRHLDAVNPASSTTGCRPGLTVAQDQRGEPIRSHLVGS